MPVSRTSPTSRTSPDDLRRTPAQGAPPSPARPSAAPPSDTASDVVRWAVFSCALVPVVLVWYGTSLAGAAGTALGLAAVTGVCRMLLRQSERGRRGCRTRRPGSASRTGGGTAGAVGRGRAGHTGRVARGRTEAAATRREIRRSTDRFPRTRPHTFSQLLTTVHPWLEHPLTPVPPGPKGSPGTRAPYGDRPLGQGALPCTAHECNAS
uniref:Uncharacterized protein n=1 Tax=Streptomyces avermitilis TaxID=33903 RepID=A0A499VG23_STRAX|nr:hypothetical protein SAVMC3_60120 [Streptomyces avermitilis]